MDTNNRKTIEDILTKWGKGAHTNPANNSALKSEVMSKVPYVEYKAPIKTPYPWLSIAFAGVAILVFFVNISPGEKMLPKILPAILPSERSVDIASPLEEQAVAPSHSSNSSKDSYVSMPTTYVSGGSPITDKREFLKTYYNANIKTRNVSDTKNKVELIVRGFGGRVDSSSAGEKNGYISFAIPAEQLSIFKEQMKSLGLGKLYTEELSSENLLPQKQYIEGEKAQTEKTLTSLKNDRAQIIKNHNQIVNSYQLRINDINKEIAVLEFEWQSAGMERRAQITARINVLQNEKSSVLAYLAKENSDYQNKIYSLDSQIKYSQMNLESLKKQDQNLVDNVATVNGTIGLSWVSLWQIADIYIPGPLLAWILILGGALAYIRHRRRYLDIGAIT